jgi:Ca-activated chloride channel family protein
MSFIWPSLLFALFFVPLLILLYLQVQGRRRKFAARYGSLGIVHDAAGSGIGLRRHIPPTVFLGGLTILLFSLARPQATVSVPRIEGTVMLTVDVSGSMAANDLQPTRMEAAKAAARQFVESQPTGISVGVVVFSDGGISVQPPTDNREETLDTINRLVPRRGTSIGNGILVALNAIVVNAGDPPILNTNTNNSSAPVEPVPAPQGWYPSAVILLLTDGENTEEPDPIMAANLAAELGVRLYTVGVGTAAGTTIEAEGFTVHTALDEPLLQYMAASTGGMYYNAGNEEELRKIYDDLEPKLYVRPEEIEMTSLFAGLGMIIFLIGGLLSLLWFGHVP